MQYEEPPHDPYYDASNVAPIRPAQHHNLEAERALLGAILLEPNLAPHTRDLLDPDDFYDPKHETLWTAIHTISERDGLLPDHASVVAELSSIGEFRTLGPAFLPALLSAATSTSPDQVRHHAGLVRDAARARRVATRLTRGLQLINTTSPDNLEFHLAEIVQEVTDAATDFGPSSRRSPVDYVAMQGLFSRPRTPTQWVIAPVLAAGRISLLYAPGKTGKSLVAMEAAAAIATGRAALATDVPADPTHVLYIDQEMTEEDWIDRLTEMGYGRDDEQTLAEHLHLAQLQAWPPMDTPAGGLAVESAAMHTGARVVIIDTASKVLEGEENSNDTQQAFYRNTLIPLKRAGIAVLVLDHTGKDLERGARGGSAKTDNIDLAFELLRRGKDLLTLRCTHSRIRSDLLDEPTFLRRTTAPLAHLVEHHNLSEESAGATRPTFLMDRVSRYIEANPGHSKTAIETAVKGKAEYVRLALELLVTEQYIEVRKGTRNTRAHHSIRPFREEGSTDD